MSLGKLPVIKSLVSGSHNRRRLRSELTLDMIGPPLGDFRHTMHVGRGGDVFGDTSFLSNHGGTPEASKDNFFLRTLRQVRRSPLRSRQSQEEAAPPPISPIIKNAISLPQLNEPANGASEKFTFKSNPISSSAETQQHYGLASGFCTIPRLSRTERALESSPSLEAKLELDDQLSDSLQSFQLDFGPSLLSEVFEVFSLPKENVYEEVELGHTSHCNGEKEAPTIYERDASPHRLHPKRLFDTARGSKCSHVPWEKEEASEAPASAPYRVQVTLNGGHPSVLAGFQNKGPPEDSGDMGMNPGKGPHYARSINVIQGHESVSFGQKPVATAHIQKLVYDSGEVCPGDFGYEPQVLAHEHGKLGSAMASEGQGSEEDSCSSEEEKKEEEVEEEEEEEEEDKEEEEEEEDEEEGEREVPKFKALSLRERSHYATLHNDSFAYADEDDEIKV
ncbi:cdc42 effector protein 1 [Rhinatrema bivittatum]|uniref:cdc42 effector protein 1 n=1 Tax=Rhinatrema bivittatum TaxID=194408 RepID=UPI00112B6F81|nr:cdc42 effector protein 1 [Rhinatrema bivittatum]XP_029445909.1 cdc42 effector protein 1 [Rhinatrema bivittatum]XP_029445910.1 cdc42 effector protein 1 [Rhinatrema bivittatum]